MKKRDLMGLALGGLGVCVVSAALAEETKQDQSAPAPVASPVVSYCQKQFLKDQNGVLYCNWADTSWGACYLSHPRDRQIQKGAITHGPTDSGLCNDGSIVVQLTSK